jgi:hypothetical protein
MYAFFKLNSYYLSFIIQNATMALLDMIVKTSVRHAKRLLVNDSMFLQYCTLNCEKKGQTSFSMVNADYEKILLNVMATNTTNMVMLKLCNADIY